jgi:hypothetical protein
MKTHIHWPPTGFYAAGLLLAVLATSGCDVVLTSAKLPAVREDRILGEWKDLGTHGSKPDPEPVIIRFEEGQYRLGSAEQFAKGEFSEFSLARAGNVLIAQLPSKDHCDEFAAQKGKPCWGLYRLELLGNKLNWYDFDAERMARESITGTLNVVHSLHRERKQNGAFDNIILISADSPELAQFLETYMKRRAALRLTGRLERVR